MKAAQINEYGDPSVVTIADIEQPHPTEGKVGIEVHAASINPFDTVVRAGYMKEMIPLQLPVTVGGDLAGVVVEVGDDTTGFAVGDSVYGQANVVAGNSGAFAEYAVTSAKQIAKMPNNVDFKQAAALPLVGVSALQALNKHLALQPGQKLFIHGGAGGIGTVAIQIAKHIGAYVVTTATGEGVEYVKQLGADEVIDYKLQNFADVLHDFDAVFDTVGGEDFNKSFAILKSGGTAVTMIAEPDEAKANELGITAIRQSTHATTKALDELRELVESGIVTPHIDKVFPLDQVKEAFEARETGTIRGKVVLEVK
jgi:NADPH:quinone reductase-like Zn-dependent oxidoreductase